MFLLFIFENFTSSLIQEGRPIFLIQIVLIAIDQQFFLASIFQKAYENIFIILTQPSALGQLMEMNTVRPRDTRPQAARTSQVHVFELGPKIFEMNEFM